METTTATNKRIFYHGTSADNLESIIKYGLSVDESKIWNCSSDEIYLWCPIAAGEANGRDEKEYHEEGFKMANESGQIACAIAKDCRVVVLKIELEDNDYIQPDLSCENMEGRGAFCYSKNILPSEITEIHVSNDLSLIKGYFINILLNNEYNDCEFTEFEKMVSRSFSESYIFEELDGYIEFEKINIFA